MNASSKPIRGWYHVCSDGNFASAIFLDDEDFKAGMNRIAVCKLKTGVVVVADVLMDNHFHFEIQSEDYDQVVKFAKEYKRLTAMYNAAKYGPGCVAGSMQIKIIPVTTPDYAKTLLCYILKNPTKARIAKFYEYKWSTASCCFFRNAPKKAAVPAGSIPRRKMRTLIHSHAIIPDDWLIAEGVILPSNYIPVKLIEDMFGGPRGFMYFLSQYGDDQIDNDLGEWNDVSLPDAELRVLSKELSVKMFGTSKMRSLSAPHRVRLAKDLRRRYLCSRKQLARIVNLPVQEIERQV